MKKYRPRVKKGGKTEPFTRVTVLVPTELRKLMNKFRERVNFSRIASSAIQKALHDLEIKDGKKKAS